jgi:murein DD-endopeptidase MepM/ murein hydrolase activator NlpD
MKKFLAPLLVIPLLLLQSCVTGPNIKCTFGVMCYGNKHTGVDFHGSTGTKIIAPMDGVVIGVQDKKILAGSKYSGSYFNISARIQHANDLETDYGHMDSVLVQVIRGVTVIGTMGTTGFRDSVKDRRPPKYPHLHFEVWTQDRRIDPMPFFVGCFDPSKTYGPKEMVYPAC